MQAPGVLFLHAWHPHPNAGNQEFLKGLCNVAHAIGIVVFKLDALKLARRTGDLPQNVNFATKEEIERVKREAVLLS